MVTTETETRTVSKRAVCILLECFLVFTLPWMDLANFSFAIKALRFIHFHSHILCDFCRLFINCKKKHFSSRIVFALTFDAFSQFELTLTCNAGLYFPGMMSASAPPVTAMASAASGSARPSFSWSKISAVA